MGQSLRTILNPEGIHDPIGYSHIGITNGKRLAFIAGQTASDKDYNIVGVGDLAQQTAQVLKNLGEALKEIGATWENVVKTTIYTTQPHEYKIIGNEMAKVLKEVKPPSQVILGVTGLAKPELLIEIEAFVVLD